MKESNIPYLATLVVRARQNDSDAFAELYALTFNKVYNYARHYLRDDFLAHDAVQEIYISALKNLCRLHDPTLFLAWLNRISFHVCYDMSKKLNRETVLTLIGEDTEVDKTIVDSISDPIMHIVRNSMDHGIEKTAEERVL